MGLLAQLFQAHAAPRPLVNADVRLPLREDFPDVVHVKGYTQPVDLSVFKDVVLAQLDKIRGTDGPDHIVTIAYPHKSPSRIFPAPHPLTLLARRFQAALRHDIPQVDWRLATGLCELRHLNRSSSKAQGLVPTLRAKHHFGFVAADQIDPLPFMDRNNNAPSYFIVFDDAYEQGTTAANMISFLHHNGGHVLAAASAYPPQQQKSFQLRADKNAIPAIAKALAGFAWVGAPAGTRQQYINDHIDDYMQELETALQHVGLSLYTLTAAECAHMVQYFTPHPYMDKMNYNSFIAALYKKTPRQKLAQCSQSLKKILN